MRLALERPDNPFAMIQIQIAGGLSEQGVFDTCWVLLDPADPLAPPLVEPAAVAPVALSVAPAHRVVTDRRVAAGRSSQVPQVADEPSQLRADVGERSDDPSPGKAELVHHVLRLLVLAAALAGAWWLATAKLQPTTPPAARSAATSASAAASAAAVILAATSAATSATPIPNHPRSTEASRP